MKKLKTFADLQEELYQDGEIEHLVIFIDGNTVIHNPFMDVTGRFKVDPIKEYGAENIEKFKKGMEEVLNGRDVENMTKLQLLELLPRKENNES